MQAAPTTTYQCVSSLALHSPRQHDGELFPDEYNLAVARSPNPIDCRDFLKSRLVGIHTIHILGHVRCDRKHVSKGVCECPFFPFMCHGFNFRCLISSRLRRYGIWMATDRWSITHRVKSTYIWNKFTFFLFQQNDHNVIRQRKVSSLVERVMFPEPRIKLEKKHSSSYNCLDHTCSVYRKNRSPFSYGSKQTTKQNTSLSSVFDRLVDIAFSLNSYELNCTWKISLTLVRVPIDLLIIEPPVTFYSCIRALI